MADVTIESRMSQLEAAQAAHDAWFRRMERLMEQLHEEIARERREAERRLQESRAEAERERADTERRLQQRRKEAERERAEAARRYEEFRAQNERERAEAERERTERRKQDERAAREVWRQIAALGDKFGGFAEGMALPSMERRLRERFGTTAFDARLRRRHGSEEIEVDALAHAGGETNIACVVEVKSRLRQDGIDQLLRALESFPRFFPEHRGKRLIGVLAAVDVPPDLRDRVLCEGLVLARIRDDVFEFQVPADFEPRVFPNPAAAPN